MPMAKPFVSSAILVSTFVAIYDTSFIRPIIIAAAARR